MARIDSTSASAASFHTRGSRQDDDIRRMLVERHCTALSDPRYDEIGVFQKGDETWIVPGDTADRIQELHMLILHSLVGAIERAMGHTS